MIFPRIFLFLLVLLSFTVCNSQTKKLIAFSSDGTKNERQGIYIMDENGDGLQLVAISELNCYNPVFSPDGNKIVFRATNGKSDYLYMIDLKDSASWNFPVFLDGGVDPIFSPDGKELLYRSEKLGTNAIYITEFDSGESFEISDGSMSFHAEFDNTGDRVIYSSSADETPDLVILDLNDSSENAQKTIIKSKDAELMGTFSRDASIVAFAAFDVNYKGTVYTCNPDGSNKRTISKGMNSSYSPKFSPDGTLLAFISDTGGKMELYICNIDGSGIKKISSNAGNTHEYDWSSDGQKIVYEDKLETASSIKVYDLKTGKTENLTGSNANNVSPSFQD
jgi:Tol biopolymer transport system component